MQLTNLGKALCEIFDFPHELVGLAFKEAVQTAGGKLLNTWCVVNEELTYITAIKEGGNYIMDINHQKIEVASLKPFLPDTGMYSWNGSTVILEKLPKKQWKKSISSDFYRWEGINYSSGFVLSSEEYNNEIVKWIFNAEKEQFFLFDENLYIMKTKVGHLNENKELTVTNPLFYQDVLDWVNKKGYTWTLHMK